MAHDRPGSNGLPPPPKLGRALWAGYQLGRSVDPSIPGSIKEPVLKQTNYRYGLSIAVVHGANLAQAKAKCCGEVAGISG